MDDIKLLRGTQCTVGKLSFPFPAGPPTTDDEVLEVTETMAEIREEIEGPKAVVNDGRKFLKEFQNDLDRYYADENGDVKQPGIPMEDAHNKPPPRPRKAKKGSPRKR